MLCGPQFERLSLARGPRAERARAAGERESARGTLGRHMEGETVRKVGAFLGSEGFGRDPTTGTAGVPLIAPPKITRA